MSKWFGGSPHFFRTMCVFFLAYYDSADRCATNEMNARHLWHYPQAVCVCDVSVCPITVGNQWNLCSLFVCRMRDYHTNIQYRTVFWAEYTALVKTKSWSVCPYCSTTQSQSSTEAYSLRQNLLELLWASFLIGDDNSTGQSLWKDISMRGIRNHNWAKHFPRSTMFCLKGKVTRERHAVEGGRKDH